jgi:chromosomal replication initiation ATPase DnaA
MSQASLQINAARHIARAAESQIKARTGMRMRVMLYTTEEKHTPQQILRIIAGALNMHPDAYTMKTRKREVAELRFLSALLLRKFFPRLTLKQIAVYYGGQDHTSIMNGVMRATQLLETFDTVFTKKYNTALNAITSWIKEQEIK